jgi:hypothetical protein
VDHDRRHQRHDRPQGGGVTEHRPTWIYGEDGLRDGRPLAYVGRYHYRMRVVDGRLRIASKRCTLRMTSLRQVADVAIIL